MFHFGILLTIFLMGCQPAKKEIPTTSQSFNDQTTVYLQDANGIQISRKMYLNFSCILEGATTTKRTELGYYLEPLDSITQNSYLELREVSLDSETNSTYSFKELLIVNNLALSNLSIISLLVAKDSNIVGTQTSVTTLPQVGQLFLEFNKQTGLGLFHAMSANAIPANMKCTTIRVP